MAHLTEEEFAVLQARNRNRRPARGPTTVKLPHADSMRRLQALGRLKVGALNKSEKAYADHLETQRVVGMVAWYRFEGVKLRLADNTFYTPDFAVMLADGTMQMHEVKGFWQDDARAKIKIAAEMYPFQFIAVTVKTKRDGGGWEVEAFN